MKKGQWIRIINMEGEPQYGGKIGQVEFIDDAGQIHGTWGGLALQQRDSYELLTDEQVAEIKAEEAREASEYKPPFVEGARPVEVPFVATRSLSRLERLNGAEPKQVMCKVILDLNGRAEYYRQLVAEHGDNFRGGKACIIGVPDNMCGQIYDRIKRNIGQDCCPVCRVVPCDMRKNEEDYLPAIDQACELAMKEA